MSKFDLVPRAPIIMTAMDASAPSFNALKAALLDLSQPMGKRTRAVFYLRTRGGKEDLKVLLEGAFILQMSESAVC